MRKEFRARCGACGRVWDAGGSRCVMTGSMYGFSDRGGDVPESPPMCGTGIGTVMSMVARRDRGFFLPAAKVVWKDVRRVPEGAGSFFSSASVSRGAPSRRESGGRVRERRLRDK